MKDNYFLYVGNAYPHKNVQLLIRAAREAHARVIYVGKNDYFYQKLGVVPRTVSDAELTRGFSKFNLNRLRAGFIAAIYGFPVFLHLDVPLPVVCVWHTWHTPCVAAPETATT